MTMTFKTNDTELRHLNGYPVTIHRSYTEPDAEHDKECLPMYAVTVGEQSFDCWSDEIVGFHEDATA